jgi:hypothetical protein
MFLVGRTYRDHQAKAGSSCEFLQQGFSVLQIRRVEPLGKPTVHRREQVVGRLALALALPQAGEAGGGSQFPGFGLLTAGDG